MTKTYILDTSVIVNDPYCLQSFENSEVIIHERILSELDKLKTFSGEIGRNARLFTRLLDTLSSENDISKGINYSGVLINLDINRYEEEFGAYEYADNQILSCAKSAKDEGKKPVVVSQDINLKLRARSIGIEAISHGKEKTTIDEIYSGITTIVDERVGTLLKENQKIDSYEHPDLRKLLPNQCVIFKDEEGRNIAYGRKIKNEKIKFVNGTKAWGISARNTEQAMALDMLMDPDVHLVSLAGIAGCGKTLLCMAAGLELVAVLKQYKKLMIYRPLQAVGNEIGFLPGDLQDKLEPWMGAIKDSMEVLVPTHKNKNNNHRKPMQNSWKNALAQFGDQIHLEALTYIRGRSIANAFILLDETQNLSKEEIKTILTRVGMGSKIVITGDIEQIDNSKLDVLNNGLTYAIDKFRKSEIAGHISLKEGERSQLAKEAAEIL